jgi:excisionase family DNA binding protein
MPVLLSAAQVARIFGRSERTIRNWVRAGHLRPVRVGRSVFFRADDIHALLDAG